MVGGTVGGTGVVGARVVGGTVVDVDGAGGIGGGGWRKASAACSDTAIPARSTGRSRRNGPWIAVTTPLAAAQSNASAIQVGMSSVNGCDGKPTGRPASFQSMVTIAPRVSGRSGRNVLSA